MPFILRLILGRCIPFLLLVVCLVIFATSKATRITPARIGNDYGSENSGLDLSEQSFDADFDNQADGAGEDYIGVPDGPQLDEGSSRVAGGGFAGCGQAPLNQLDLSNQSTRSDGYIVGGETQRYGEFPQYARLDIRLGRRNIFCGATIISDRHVLTAAHCVKLLDSEVDPSYITVIFGEHNTENVDAHEIKVQASQTCISPAFKFFRQPRYDWALITLEKPVKFNNYIQPACLPNDNQLIHTYGPKSTCFLVGAGASELEPNRLDPEHPKVKFPKYIKKLRTKNVSCRNWQFGDIDESRVCYAGASDSYGDGCTGDSGGPILCLDERKRWTLMASVSYAKGDCKQSEYVTVYARMRTILPKIQKYCEVDLLRLKS